MVIIQRFFWADLEASPYLVSWLEKNPIIKFLKRACVIGCGLEMMQKL